MTLLKCALTFYAATLGVAFAKGVLLGGAGATATAVTVIASAGAMRRCACRREEPPARTAPSSAA